MVTPIFSHNPDSMMGETSIIYTRPDGRRVEVALQHPCPLAPYPELIMAAGTEDEMNVEQYYQFFRASLDEIKVLRDFLNRPEVTDLLKG